MPRDPIASAEITPVGAPREFRLPTRCEYSGLLDPVLAFDAALEVENAADALDIGHGPFRDLFIARDAHRVELLLDQHANAANALQVVGGAGWCGIAPPERFGAYGA